MSAGVLIAQSCTRWYFNWCSNSLAQGGMSAGVLIAQSCTRWYCNWCSNSLAQGGIFRWPESGLKASSQLTSAQCGILKCQRTITWHFPPGIPRPDSAPYPLVLPLHSFPPAKGPARRFPPRAIVPPKAVSSADGSLLNRFLPGWIPSWIFPSWVIFGIFLQINSTWSMMNRWSSLARRLKLVYFYFFFKKI